MNSQKGTKPVIWFIIIAVVIGVGYVLINGKLKVKSEKRGVAKEEIDIETSDWKTYRSDKYGFELKYPSGWGNCSPDVEKNYEKSVVQLLCIEQKISGDQLGLSRVIRLLIDLEKVRAYSANFEKLVQYLKTDHENALRIGLYSVFKEGPAGSVTFVQSGAGDVGSWGNFYIFLKNHILAVGYSNAADIAEQILSTFKFTK